MSIRNAIVAITFCFFAAGLPAAAFADAGRAAFEEGKTLVGQGDFEGAMQAFANAVRADRANAEYMQNYSLVRQVVLIRNAMAKETDLERWQYYARALHTYYVSEKLYDQAFTLDEEIHRRVDSAASAAMLAETQLAMNKNAEAIELLSKLSADKTNVVTESLEGIALARVGKKEAALQHAGLVEVTDEHGPGVLYCAARLQAATGNGRQAAALLTRCFEQIPPSQLDGFKSHAKMTPEFTPLAATSEFQLALKTESKVQESSCSSGSSCAGCPMRGNCSKEAGK